MKTILLTITAILGVTVLAPQANAKDDHIRLSKNSDTTYSSYQLEYTKDVELEVFFEDKCGSTTLDGEFVEIPDQPGKGMPENVLLAKFRPFTFFSSACSNKPEVRSAKFLLKADPRAGLNLMTVIVPDFLSIRLNKVENQ